MSIFIFKDTSLNEGFIINPDTNKELIFSDLVDTKNMLFVVPNEILSYTKHNLKLKNKKNLHASIINSLNNSHFEEQQHLSVLESKLTDNDFYTITKNNLNKLKNIFKESDQKIKITSDLLFFKELFNENIIFNEFIYYQDEDSLAKLNQNAFNLLDTTSNLKTLTLKDICPNTDQLFTYHELDTFDPKNLFAFSANKKLFYGLISVVLLLNFIGLLNIYSNWNQITKMDDSLINIYKSLYPKDEIIDINKQINTKLLSLMNESDTEDKKIISLIDELSNNPNIVEINYDLSSKDILTIKCVFLNKDEETNYINQGLSKKYNLTITNRSTNGNYLLTEFSYEL